MKNKKLGLMSLLLMFLAVTSFSSCAKWKNRVDRDGSWIGAKQGDFIVVKQSGGIITDVWLLEDQMVQSEEASDGWLFQDKDGNPINVGGDMKSIRLESANKQEMFSRYVEYHMEFDTLTYHERLALSRK